MAVMCVRKQHTAQGPPRAVRPSLACALVAVVSVQERWKHVRPRRPQARPWPHRRAEHQERERGPRKTEKDEDTPENAIPRRGAHGATGRQAERQRGRERRRQTYTGRHTPEKTI